MFSTLKHKTKKTLLKLYTTHLVESLNTDWLNNWRYPIHGDTEEHFLHFYIRNQCRIWCIWPTKTICITLHHKEKKKKKKFFGYKLDLDPPKGRKWRKSEHFNNNKNKKDKAHHISSLTKSSKYILILFGISIAHWTRGDANLNIAVTLTGSFRQLG